MVTALDWAEQEIKEAGQRLEKASDTEHSAVLKTLHARLEKGIRVGTVTIEDIDSFLKQTPRVAPVLTEYLAFLAAHGLQGLQPFFAAQGTHGLHAASSINRGFGLATGNRVGCSVPTVAACPGVDRDNAPPTAIPAPTKAGITVTSS